MRGWFVLVSLAWGCGVAGCTAGQSGPPPVVAPPPGYSYHPDAVVSNPAPPPIDAAHGSGNVDAGSAGGGADGGAAADVSDATGDDANTVGADAGPGGGTAKHPVGGPCSTADDCEGQGVSCVEWPPGKHLCTVPQCNAGKTCPAGSTCAPLGDAGWACLPDCSTDADCRPGYPCKAIQLVEGIARVCYGVNAAAGGTAMLCKANTDCAKHAACLAPSLGGYCAVLACDDAHPCPAKTACVDFPNAGKACAATCADASSCPGGPAGLQECVEAAALDGELVQVCLPVFQGKPSGNTCQSDDQCAVGVCKLTSKGSCAGSGALCLDDAECGSDGPCVEDANFVKGICLVPCQDSTTCPEDTLCEPESPSSGSCRATCKSLADQFSCNAKQSELCLFGYTPEDTSGEGAFGCAASPPGSPGWPCDPAADDCKPPAFCMPGNDPGTGQCVTYCDSTMPNGLDYCPWGTVCVSNASSTQCMKTCPGGTGCPDGFHCKEAFLGLPFPVKFCGR